MMLSTIWGLLDIVGSAPGHSKWVGDEEPFSDSTEYLLQKKGKYSGRIATAC